MNAPSKDDWYNPEATTFGDRVAGAREVAGMTQEELARRLGIKLKTLRAWEDDLNEPRANKLSMLAGVLNVSLLWLISGEGDAPDGPDERNGGNPDVANILRDMRDLRAQITASADRLAMLERSLRSSVREQPVE